MWFAFANHHSIEWWYTQRINSTLSFSEMEDIKRKIQGREVKILYIAPERLALEEFKIFLSIWMDLLEDRKGYNNEPLGVYKIKV